MIFNSFAIFATSWFLEVRSRGSVIKGVSNINLFTLEGQNINVYFTKRLYTIWANIIGNICNPF